MVFSVENTHLMFKVCTSSVIGYALGQFFLETPL